MQALLRKPAQHSARADKLPRSRRARLVSQWLVVLAFGLGGSGSVFAAPCTEFVDVDAASAYCGNVEWLKIRGITLGCTASQYCPNEPVSRLQMAAFMNRLGKALQPVFLYTYQLASSFPGLGETILCHEPPRGFPESRNHLAAVKRKVDFDDRTVPTVDIDDRKNPKATAVHEIIDHQVHAPPLLGTRWRRGVTKQSVGSRRRRLPVR